MCHCECECDHGSFKTNQNTNENASCSSLIWDFFFDFDTDSNRHPNDNQNATSDEAGEFRTTLKLHCAMHISGIAVVSSIAIPEPVSLSSFQFQVSHNTTLQALFPAPAPATTETMPHDCRAVSDVIRSSVLAGERGGHTGGEIAIYIKLK